MISKLAVKFFFRFPKDINLDHYECNKGMHHFIGIRCFFVRPYKFPEVMVRICGLIMYTG